MRALIDSEAVVDPTARLGARCQILDHACVGAHTSLADGVIVQPRAFIGLRCALGAGVVVGHDAVIEGRVELGPKVIVRERARICAGARCGADVRIGHDAVVGRNMVILPGAKVPPGVCVTQTGTEHVVIEGANHPVTGWYWVCTGRLLIAGACWHGTLAQARAHPWYRQRKANRAAVEAIAAWARGMGWRNAPIRTAPGAGGSHA